MMGGGEIEGEMMEEELQQLRSQATGLLLREDWKEYIHLYSTFIQQRLLSHPNHQHQPDLRRCLCMALSNRAEARLRMRDPSGALEDCDQALQIEPSHLKALVCRGKALLDLDRYSGASGCFRRALDLPTEGNSSETLPGLLKRCERLEAQSRTGAIDLSDWVLSGFRGKPPELAEYVGPVDIKRSGNRGRGIFATKSIEAGTPLIVTKAVAIGRGILPVPVFGSGDNNRLVMWKDFVDKLLDAAGRSSRTLQQIYALSTGVDEDGLAVPDMGLFRPDAEEKMLFPEDEGPDMDRILKILDVNCLTEEAASAKVLGKNRGYYGVGLWILPSLVNHACNPNARRLHIGDHVLVHASRDVKAGEEITFAYFDVLLPLKKRREVMSAAWGFQCRCQRCRFEDGEGLGDGWRRREELGEMEMALESGSDAGGVVARLEVGMRRWMVKGREEKGYLRASFWSAYSGAFRSRKRGWDREGGIPTEAVVAQSVSDAVGGDERVLKVAVEGLKTGRGGGAAAAGGGCGGVATTEEMERRVRLLGRGVYGKVMRKQAALRALFELIALAD